MRIAYLDCFAGISGDMFLGALLDAGVPLAALSLAVDALGLGATLHVEKVDRSGIFSTKVHVLEHGLLAEGALHPGGQPTHQHGGIHAHEHTHSHPHENPTQHVHEHSREHKEDVQTHPHTHTHEAAEKHEHAKKHSHEHAHEPEPEHNHVHVHGRSLTEIRVLIEATTLAQPVKNFALRAFELLGRSEAKIHNVPVDQIHFHEVGAVDAIVDIVAAAAGVAFLTEESSLEWFCSAINVGGGMVECAHGTFPVPAPATADLLLGMPTYSAHVQKELVTPTGAALLQALSPRFESQPMMRVKSIGYGAGTRNPKDFPNVLRLSLGDSEGAPKSGFNQAPPQDEETIMVLETALDDATPQLLAYVAERALEIGALDVMLTPVVMKKGRPATLVTVLCDPPLAARIEDLLLRETTTLGIRMHREQRSCLSRRHLSVSTSYGEIRIKVGALLGEELNAMPEYEDCRAAARQHKVPLKQVTQAALAAYALSPVL